MRYQIEIDKTALKYLAKMRDKALRQRIRDGIERLAVNPREQGAIKMQGTANDWRIRIGDYRIIYTVEDTVLRVLVIRIGHRRDVYE